MMKGKLDIGWTWASIMAIWGQMGIILGIANAIMTAGIFYATTVKGYIPLLLYLAIVIIGIICSIAFVLRIGLSGYYRFFNKNSAVDEIDRKLILILKHYKIDDK